MRSALGPIFAGLTLGLIAVSGGCSRTCDLHQEPLQADRMQTSYGLVRFPDGYFEAERRTFPNANSILCGGCFVDLDDADFHEVWFCASCRTAEKAWKATHR